MTIYDFIKDIAPKRCGVNSVYGEIAVKFLEEQKINKNLQRKKFKNVREWAELGCPYKPKNKREWKRCVTINEIAILKHYQKYHNENNSKDINRLEKSINITSEEKKITEAAWWQG